ncbi:MAG: stage III sporulation protein AA [Solirubrobacterales bacterium]
MKKIDTNEIYNILPEGIRRELNKCENLDNLQEIRARSEKPLSLHFGKGERLTDYIVNSQDIKSILQKISSYSIYAFEEELRNGYITIKGGHRVGICGRCVVEGNNVKTIKNPGSLNFRICRELIGCSDKIINYIFENGNVLNTIIISPPKCGKTTIVRDLARNISNGRNGAKGKKVCIIDERSEIGACFQGVPQLDVGVRTDILDGCPKSQGIIMAVRSMAPEVVVCDEIGTEADAASIITAMNSGVGMITTIHGEGLEDLYKRPVFNELIKNKVFKRAVVLSCRNGAGTVEYIYDITKNKIIMEEPC